MTAPAFPADLQPVEPAYRNLLRARATIFWVPVLLVALVVDNQLLAETLFASLSTDGSVDIIRKYTGQLSGWVSEKDRGQGDAINKGLARAKGGIAAWLNSDDYYLPGAISSAVKLFEQNPDVALVYADMLAVDQNGQTLNVLRYGQYTLKDLLCYQIIGQPAVFFRREASEKAGGLDISFHYMLDHHLWIRIARQGRILYVPQTWAVARYHPGAKNLQLAVEFPREAFYAYQLARDDDGDGIPNGQDPDWTKPADGTGYKAQNKIGQTDKTEMTQGSKAGKVTKSSFGKGSFRAGTSGAGRTTGAGVCDGTGPKRDGSGPNCPRQNEL